jgi:hypothetical protein
MFTESGTRKAYLGSRYIPFMAISLPDQSDLVFPYFKHKNIPVVFKPCEYLDMDNTDHFFPVSFWFP